ncbi:extracellular polygalacturonase, putative [Talaromyces stipitatus ATCC 10500]|uniref:endo-polygalacturonase n=1 Tax=Talaromyces stipitatus (strain ATCC 10500 / CBS 375.48 / QM 6759 / NRRL 1006) TaxID=441959 RepID=B8LZP2_TALSN|nr:extracellular polygalacturonase, putative [Talaromyces stipitatus ATCC 10500]EED22465.1 extracellular polygalacturonase, putative [Talaromyces stipitatus ATCC 10500]
MVNVFSTCAVFLALTTSVIAKPVAEPAITPAPKLLDKRATSCTFSESNGASSASESQKSCSTIILSNVAVPSGQTLDLSDLPDHTTVVFEGETTWSYQEWDGPLLQISGNGITVEGASGAYLNPDGARWWDGKGSNGGKKKPKFFSAHDLTSSSITNLLIQNTPVQAVSINGCNGLNITDMTIDNSAGDTEGGHNTDGFDIGSSTNVVITGANVYNQDDCVAVNSGTDITFSGGVCSGGHGLSIGSVGGRSDNTVETVKFENSEVKNSVNGIRIKATEGDTGTITGVTYSQIILQDISGYGILIEQNYNGSDLNGGTPSSGIPITELTVEHISGSGAVESGGYNVVIACGKGACSNWTWEDVVVTGGKDYGSCSNVPSVASCSA